MTTPPRGSSIEPYAHENLAAANANLAAAPEATVPIDPFAGMNNAEIFNLMLSAADRLGMGSPEAGVIDRERAYAFMGALAIGHTLPPKTEAVPAAPTPAQPEADSKLSASERVRAIVAKVPFSFHYADGGKLSGLHNASRTRMQKYRAGRTDATPPENLPGIPDWVENTHVHLDDTTAEAVVITPLGVGYGELTGDTQSEVANPKDLASVVQYAGGTIRTDYAAALQAMAMFASAPDERAAPVGFTAIVDGKTEALFQQAFAEDPKLGREIMGDFIDRVINSKANPEIAQKWGKLWPTLRPRDDIYTGKKPYIESDGQVIQRPSAELKNKPASPAADPKSRKERKEQERAQKLGGIV